MKCKTELKSLLLVIVVGVTVLFAVRAFGYRKNFAVLKEREIIPVENSLKNSSYKKITKEKSIDKHFYAINRIDNGRSKLGVETKIKNNRAKYLSYLQGGGVSTFRTPYHGHVSFDLFIPLWQRDLQDLVFTDLRIYDKNGGGTEGNFHLGYRHLFEDSEQIIGIFAGFDRKKTDKGNFFNQVMLGAEYWYEKFFVGINGYQPVGKTTKVIGVEDKITEEKLSNPYRNLTRVTKVDNRVEERAMQGGDFEFGYEITEGLIGYAGGYYFSREGVENLYGPKARLTYDWYFNGSRPLNIVDKVGLEGGVQNDKVRGSTWYVSANIRLGLWFKNENKLSGIFRHMVDPVRRDIDINTGEAIEQMAADSLLIDTINDNDPNAIYRALDDLSLNAVNLGLKVDISKLDPDRIKNAANKNLWIFYSGNMVGVVVNRGPFSPPKIYVYLAESYGKQVVNLGNVYMDPYEIEYSDEGFDEWAIDYISNRGNGGLDSGMFYLL